MNKALVTTFLVVSLFSLALFVTSNNQTDSNVTYPYPKDQIQRDLALIKNKFYTFSLDLPAEVEANAGENITVNATITNTGQWTLRQFNLTLAGLPYEYELAPKFEELMVVRDWNPKQGLFRIPQKFQIKVNIPSDAIGVHFVNITGQEHFSWRKASNSTSFILKVTPLVPLEPNVTVSQILVPDEVKSNEAFNITFIVNNNNIFPQVVNISLNIPADWSAAEKKKTFAVKPNESLVVYFGMTPTNTSGNISVNVEYPFKENIFTIVREGPFLTPISEMPKVEPPKEVKKPVTGIAAVIEYVRNLSPIFVAIIVLIAIIVIWFIAKLVKFYSSRRKPEGIKRHNNNMAHSDLV